MCLDCKGKYPPRVAFGPPLVDHTDGVISTVRVAHWEHQPPDDQLWGAERVDTVPGIRVFNIPQARIPRGKWPIPHAEAWVTTA